MQTCYNCGKQVSDETLICPDCGALVRRYTAPANPAAAQPLPVSQEEAAQDAGRVRLHGGVKVWLIIHCVISAYLAFSSLTMAFFGAAPRIFDALSEAEREMISLALSVNGIESLDAFLSLLQSMLPMLILLTVLFAAKIFCHLYLLLRGRRLPFYLSVGVSVVGLVSCLVLGGSLVVILYFLEPVVTWLNLRQFWPRMPG